MKRSLTQLAEAVHGRVSGDGNIEITGIASIESAVPGDLVFVEDDRNLQRALASAASAVVVGESASGAKPLLHARQPRLAFALASELLKSAAQHGGGVHPSTLVHPSVRLGKDVSIAERVVLGDGVQVGSKSDIGANCVVGSNVAIGSDCRIYPNVTIYPGVKIGDRVIVHSGVVLGSDGFGYVRDKETGKYHKFPQVGSLVIEDDVEIGANSTVDRGALEVTRISRGAKIDNLVHIGHNVQIGEDVVIAAQTGFSGSIVVEKNVVIGGQVGIGEHARIEEGVMLGGQSGVLPNKVLRGKGIAFWGTPARPVRGYLKELAALARLARKD
ncbi:MAG TPA: UDP-3-O-(3-hydroxymyristoyl)glucosamine N-acyltransferase [Terriglobales bacterium]|jgi:UDP-3-O-[3-hydroxymyristoyl] glucosamine N-acyltransferase|nr:UDP-3-O-(3-hydroxymyristoyl)glucosamine N-acyltransferase [Terriglobales bacterium]